MEQQHPSDFLDIEGGDGYDVVVVGSGYGGSVAACRMSMAGFKVCLLEKGHKWEAKDFPTDSFKIWSAVRLENKNLGHNIGPKDALFQVCLICLKRRKNVLRHSFWCMMNSTCCLLDQKS